MIFAVYENGPLGDVDTCCGFGRTIEEAWTDFDENWRDLDIAAGAPIPDECDWYRSDGNKVFKVKYVTKMVVKREQKKVLQEVK